MSTSRIEPLNHLKLYNFGDPAIGCWMLDVGCWMFDVRCWMFFGFMGSFDLQEWTRIGAMNRAIGAPSTVSASSHLISNAPRRCSALRFMKAGCKADVRPNFLSLLALIYLDYSKFIEVFDRPIPSAPSIP